MHLDGLGADLFGHFAGKQLGHGRLFQARAARIAQAGRVPNQLARRFELRGAIGQTETHRLVVEDGGAKAFALLGLPCLGSCIPLDAAFAAQLYLLVAVCLSSE